ncbi:MAG TPA: DUF2071 domain-containing protein [Thermoanaerobaculia bacterium]|nr:DUF2071 domain-containing protein [Thermoanaerobaculia bacterium]
MKIRSLVRDCLCLNWALPRAGLPELPAALRYQTHAWEGEDVAFASALLFHHERVHWQALPALKLSYPQMNVRVYVLDEEGIPSVLFLRMLLPAWVFPGARLLSGSPAAVGQLDFPRPSQHPDADAWVWRAARGRRLEVAARTASPDLGAGPHFGSWERTIEFFHARPRGYSLDSDGPRRIEASHPPVAVWPARAEIAEGALLADCLGLAGRELPPLHSCWICPEIPFTFDLVLAPRLAVPHGVPHPAASRAAIRDGRMNGSSGLGASLVL